MYHLNVNTLIPKLRGHNGCQRSAQTVSRHDKCISRVRRNRGFQLLRDVRGDGLPGFPESSVHITALADAGSLDEEEIEVCDPVAQIVAAAEREHDEVVGVVNGDEAGCVAELA
jgi:hypothetical protein